MEVAASRAADVIMLSGFIGLMQSATKDYREEDAVAHPYSKSTSYVV